MAVKTTLLQSTRNKSGYKYVIHDNRTKARAKPWSVSYKGYRSAGFSTAREAAKHVAIKLLSLSKNIRAPPATMQTTNAVVTPAPNHTVNALPDTWMIKPNVRFDVPSCDLFGNRIEIAGRIGVIKAWDPCAAASFGVVFDDKPDKVFMEDLFRKGRKDWKIVEWEDDDIWETQDIRPMCPRCGHPLGTGTAAWTKCLPCGHMEPGVSSFEVLSRLRTGDPFRG